MKQGASRAIVDWLSQSYIPEDRFLNYLCFKRLTVCKYSNINSEVVTFKSVSHKNECTGEGQTDFKETEYWIPKETEG
jgi:hypothetical protein